jgi:hypothetical protein
VVSRAWVSVFGLSPTGWFLRRNFLYSDMGLLPFDDRGHRSEVADTIRMPSNARGLPVGQLAVITRISEVAPRQRPPLASPPSRRVSKRSIPASSGDR